MSTAGRTRYAKCGDMDIAYQVIGDDAHDLVSSTVREIVTGSRRMFHARGEHELKGVPGRWRLYAV